MSEENVAAFHESAAAAGRGDWDAAIRLMDPEIVFVPQRAPVQGSYVGHDAMRRFAEDTNETFDVFAPHYDDVRDLGDRVLAIGAIRIRGKGSGVETEVPSAIIVDFESGLMTRFEDFGEAKRALEAAGLSD